MNFERLSVLAGVSIVLSFGGSSCVSDRQVIAQANDAHTQLEPAVMEDPQLSKYMQEIGDRIIEGARQYEREKYGEKGRKGEDDEWMFSKSMQFHLVNSETLNAFTTGGEHMYIYSELFDTARTEDELAAVMAHEYAHVYGRHVHEGMKRQYYTAGGALALGAAGYAAGGDEHGEEYAKLAAAGGLMLGQFLGMGFTRNDEAEADELGFEFYTRAGWDPDRFGDFFQQLIDKGMDTTPEVMSDHPSLSSRVAAAQKRAANLPPEAESWRRPPVADASGYDAKKERLAAVSAKMPKDGTLAAAQTLLSAVVSCVLPQDTAEQVEARERIARAREMTGPQQ